MYRLKEWSLGTSPHGFRCHGNCYDNPSFFSGQLVTTSHIIRIEVDDKEKQLKLFTESGSCYILKYADINDFAIESTQEVLKGMNVVVDLQKCVALKEKRIESTKKKLEKLLNPNELYVVMTGGQGVTEAYFKGKDNAITQIAVSVHEGMIQDSILVADWLTGLCDWRIFPSACAVEPYHWSDNLEAVHIENVGDDFKFKGSKREIPCKSGVVTVIKKEEYIGEGLFFPDAVNGKCLFSAGISDESNNKEL